MARPLAAFYGDDFTGSTENLAQSCGLWRALWSAIESRHFAVLDATDQAELQQSAELILRLSEHRPTLAVAAQGLADALELVAFDEAQGGHLCRLIATDSPIDGLEVVLKGGQIGGEDLLARVKRGTAHPAP
jgi:uncharacterized protein YgbK (DUF1537 family)